MAGDEARLTRIEFDELKTGVTQMKASVDRLALAVDRFILGRVRDRVDGRQRRDPTLQDKSYSDDHRGYRRKDNYDARGLKMPSFNGQLHIEDFLDWITKVERFFEYMEIPDERKVKLVACQLKGGASAWWESVRINRSRQGKPKVTRWEKMKKLLKARFLPTYYYMFNQHPSSHSNHSHGRIKQPQFDSEKEPRFVTSIEVATKKEPALAEIPPNVQAPIVTEIFDVDENMLAKMGIVHEISEAIVSDITHTDVVPEEEKDIIANQTIDDMCHLIGGGLEAKQMKELCMEYEGENSSLEAMIINNFNNNEMTPPALEYEDQHEKYLEEFFMSTTEPHVASYIHIPWERFIHKFDTEEVLAEKVKELMEKINAKYKADADRCRRRKIFIDEATIQANMSSRTSFFQQGETDVGRLTNNLKEERDNHELNADLYILLASTKKRSYLLIRKADSDILYMKIAYLDETKPTRLSDFQNLISITSC